MDAFAWPAAVLLIALVAMFRFGGDISALLRRTRSASRTGVTFEPQQEEIAAPAPPPKTPAVDFDVPVSRTVLEREKLIRERMESITPPAGRAKQDLLIRGLAEARVEIEFMRPAAALFGSQLNLLGALASTHAGVTRPQAMERYNAAAAAMPEIHSGRTFDQWLQYLLLHQLVVENDSVLTLTQFGSDFLKFLVDTKQIGHRPG